MLTPLLFLAVFMAVFTTPGLIALHIQDRRTAKKISEKAT